jgi:hypothetical protein
MTLAGILKMPVLVGVKALPTFEKFAELRSEAGTSPASSQLVRKESREKSELRKSTLFPSRVRALPRTF